MNTELKTALTEIALVFIIAACCLKLGYMLGSDKMSDNIMEMEKTCMVESEEAIQECKDKYYSNLEIVNTPQITYMVIGEDENE